MAAQPVYHPQPARPNPATWPAGGPPYHL